MEFIGYSWVVQSHGLLPGEYGGMVYEVGGDEKDNGWP